MPHRANLTREQLWIQLEALRGILIAEYGFEMMEIEQIENAAVADLEMNDAATLAMGAAGNANTKMPNEGFHPSATRSDGTIPIALRDALTR